jgi:hypothetical protein
VATIPIPEGNDPAGVDFDVRMADGGTVVIARSDDDQPLKFLVADPAAVTFREITIADRRGRLRQSKANLLAAYAWTVSLDGSTIALGNAWDGCRPLGEAGIELFRVRDGSSFGRLAADAEGGTPDDCGVVRLFQVDDQRLGWERGVLKRDLAKGVSQPIPMTNHHQAGPRGEVRSLEGEWRIMQWSRDGGCLKVNFDRTGSYLEVLGTDGVSRGRIPKPANQGLLFPEANGVVLKTWRRFSEAENTWEKRWQAATEGFLMPRLDGTATMFRWYDLGSGRIHSFQRFMSDTSGDMALVPEGLAICVPGDRGSGARIEIWSIPPGARNGWAPLLAGFAGFWLTSRWSPLWRARRRRPEPPPPSAA